MIVSTAVVTRWQFAGESVGRPGEVPVVDGLAGAHDSPPMFTAGEWSNPV